MLEMIKSIIITSVLILVYNATCAQYYENIDGNKLQSAEKPSLYIGGGIGVNDYGLGSIIEIPVSNSIALSGKVGVGGWGYKVGFGLIYYPKSTSLGTGWSIGYSYATGLKNFETSLENTAGKQESVNLDLQPVSTLNLLYSYAWKLGKRGKFGVNAGYAIPFQTDRYEINTSGFTPSSVSKQVMKIMEPGGLIVGFNVMVKLK